MIPFLAAIKNDHRLTNVNERISYHMIESYK